MDPSDSACVEFLKPKTVPEGLVALGTVVQISEIQIKLQITGGITCLVDRFNVSQSFTEFLEEHDRTYNGSKPPPRLGSMFKKGQQYVCKIVERRPRKGYVEALDIIASLDPLSIQEDNLPKTLLAIPNVPLQCAVKSIEDHGYQMDIGFKGLTGFLTFDDADAFCKKHYDGKKFVKGQIVRCCLKECMKSDSDLRVVHLTLDKEAKKLSAFTKEKVTQNLLTEKCVLPGSKSFLTVMKVSKEGLVVNFMNEFAGFVSTNHLREEWHNPKENYKISDQISCSVLYFNPLTKLFALSIRSNTKKTMSYFMKNYHVGKIIRNAQVISVNGTKSITFKVHDHYKAISNVRDALDEDVSTMTKDELSSALDSSFPDKSKHRCRIKSINLADLVLVLSLRQDFMEQSFMSVEELKAGDFIEAVVKKYVNDGIIVTFGLNLRAIILNNDLHDYVSAKSYKRYPIGKTIKCRILKIDHSKQPSRVYLTNKEQLMSPDLVVVGSYGKSLVGKSTFATIAKVGPNGLIVELFNNVKGFIPRKFLSSVMIKETSDLFKVGQITPCVVYRTDPNRRSLMLGAVPFKEILKMKRQKKAENKTKNELKRLDKGNHLKEKQMTSEEKIVKPSKLQLVVKEEKQDDVNKVRFEDSDDQDASSTSSLSSDESGDDDEKQHTDSESTNLIKSRRQRSEEAKVREEKLREIEKNMMDPNRPAQSIPDFERLLLATPNSADAWIKYSKFFIDNVETEKARIVCRRALKTISFRLEKEKLKVWLHLISIEAKFGGLEKLRATIEEAEQTNDRMSLYRGVVKVLSTCGEFDEAERICELMLKTDGKSVNVWIDYILFCMEHRKDIEKARTIFSKACKVLFKSDLVVIKSRFAQLEFKFGEVERGKTMFENLLSDNPKRVDLWKVYGDMIKKFGTRQLDNEMVQQQNEQILQRIAESIELVSKKGRKKQKTST